MATEKSRKSKTTEDQLLKELLEARERVVTARDLIYKISTKLLTKLGGKVDEITIDEINSTNLPTAVKATSETVNLALTIDYGVIGLDKVIKEIGIIKKLSNDQ
jgi:hypothetical protein